MTKREYGRKLKAAIRKRGWTYAQFRRWLSDQGVGNPIIGHDQVSRWIHGQAAPSPLHRDGRRAIIDQFIQEAER